MLDNKNKLLHIFSKYKKKYENFKRETHIFIFPLGIFMTRFFIDNVIYVSDYVNTTLVFICLILDVVYTVFIWTRTHLKKSFAHHNRNNTKHYNTSSTSTHIYTWSIFVSRYYYVIIWTSTTKKNLPGKIAWMLPIDNILCVLF